MAISATTAANSKCTNEDENENENENEESVSAFATPETSTTSSRARTTATAEGGTISAAAEAFSTAELRRQLLLLGSIRCLRNAHLAPPPISVPYYRSAPPDGCGLNPAAVVWLGSWYSALVALCEMPSGLISDGLGRKPTLRLSFELLGASWLVGYGTCRWWASHGGGEHPTSAALYGVGLSQVLRALGSSLYSGTDMAFLFELLKKHKRRRRQQHRGESARESTDAIDDLVLELESRQVVLSTATEAVFAALGGLLARSCGGATPIWMSALPLLAGAGICSLLEETTTSAAAAAPDTAAGGTEPAEADGNDSASGNDAPGGGRKGRRPSFRWAAETLHREPPLRVVFGVGVLLNCGTYVAATALNPLLWQHAGLGEAAGGFLQATNSGVAALGALAAPALKKRCGRAGGDDGTRGLLVLLLGAGAAAYALMARNALAGDVDGDDGSATTTAATVAAAWLLSSVRGLGWPVLGSALNTAIGEHNDGTRATVLSLFAGAVKLGMVLAGALLGSMLRNGDGEREAASLGNACALGAAVLAGTAAVLAVAGAAWAPQPPRYAGGDDGDSDEGKKDR